MLDLKIIFFYLSIFTRTDPRVWY